MTRKKRVKKASHDGFVFSDDIDVWINGTKKRLNKTKEAWRDSGTVVTNNKMYSWKPQNFIQVVEQTREEKIKMYLKCSKQKLAEMLVECNLIIDKMPIQFVSPSEDKTAEQKEDSREEQLTKYLEATWLYERSSFEQKRNKTLYAIQRYGAESKQLTPTYTRDEVLKIVGNCSNYFFQQGMKEARPHSYGGDNDYRKWFEKNVPHLAKMF